MTHFISESTVHEYKYSIEHFPETSCPMSSGSGTNYDFSIWSRSSRSSEHHFLMWEYHDQWRGPYHAYWGPGGVKFEPNLFKLNHEMVILIGGHNSEGCHLFIQLTVKHSLCFACLPTRLWRWCNWCLGLGYQASKGNRRSNGFGISLCWGCMEVMFMEVQLTQSLSSSSYVYYFTQFFIQPWTWTWMLTLLLPFLACIYYICIENFDQQK